MDRDQIVKSLECCSGAYDCEKCCYACEGSMLGECIAILEKDALALIRELVAENERLKKTRYMAYPDGRLEMIPSIESVRADTVRDVIIELSAMIGTYQSDSTMRVADVFKMLSIIKKDILGEEQ